MSTGLYLRRKRSVSGERTKGTEAVDKRRKTSIAGEEEEKDVSKAQSLATPSSSPASPARQGIPSPMFAPLPSSSSSTGHGSKEREPPRSNSGGRFKLTRQLFDQIPFLESDPLKALEVLKKMVQESGLETLYASVNENTSRARDFADRIAELKKTVDGLLKYMLSGRPSDEDKLEKYREMKTIWAKIHGLNEAKVKLTQNAYDMVDRVIRRLDKELESIVNEIGHGKASATDKAPRALGVSSEGPSRARVRGADFDMPVDPNEPTYCECKQISFGEMIACDNVNCPIEWFHFACVGLTSKPKGKWFCKRCVASGQNKLGKKKKSRLGIIEKYASASDKSEVDHILSASDSE